MRLRAQPWQLLAFFLLGACQLSPPASPAPKPGLSRFVLDLALEAAGPESQGPQQGLGQAPDGTQGGSPSLVGGVAVPPTPAAAPTPALGGGGGIGAPVALPSAEGPTPRPTEAPAPPPVAFCALCPSGPRELRLLDEDGEPLPGVSLLAPAMISDADGRIRLPAPPAGEAALQLSLGAKPRLWLQAWSGGNLEVALPVPGSTPSGHQDWGLNGGAQSGQVLVQARDSAGLGLPGVMLRLGKQGRSIAVGQTNAQGEAQMLWSGTRIEGPVALWGLKLDEQGQWAAMGHTTLNVLEPNQALAALVLQSPSHTWPAPAVPAVVIPDWPFVADAAWHWEAQTASDRWALPRPELAPDRLLPAFDLPGVRIAWSVTATEVGGARSSSLEGHLDTTTPPPAAIHAPQAQVLAGPLWRWRPVLEASWYRLEFSPDSGEPSEVVLTTQSHWDLPPSWPPGPGSLSIQAFQVDAQGRRAGPHATWRGRVP